MGCMWKMHMSARVVWYVPAPTPVPLSVLRFKHSIVLGMFVHILNILIMKYEI